MNTPVLLIAWRRPQMLRKVIDSLRIVAPKIMFIACDGPNENRVGEAEKVAATRAVISHYIDWPCDMHYLYSDINQGCRLGVSRAISWFFSNVDEGIILEDDCIPVPRFFYLCQNLLHEYRNDWRVASIGGHNPVKTVERSNDIIFSRYFECWGWATWKRAWNVYDDQMKVLGLESQRCRLEDCFTTPGEVYFWTQLAKQLLVTDKPSSWAYRFQMCCVANNMVHAISKISLVENIGFGPDSTNCIEESSRELIVDPTDTILLGELKPFEMVTAEPTTLPDREFDLAYARLHGISFQKDSNNRLTKKFKSIKSSLRKVLRNVFSSMFRFKP